MARSLFLLSVPSTPPRSLPLFGWIGAMLVAASLAGCGNKAKEPSASQTAAKVNKEEITVHQINFVLSQQRALAPEQAASASQQVLERLIDQELAVQKAADQKLDRDPRVVQQLESARREIIARAYLEKIGTGAPKPTPQEVKTYYDSHPALFKDRRIYSFQEILIQSKPEQFEALKTRAASVKTLGELIAYLKQNDIRYATNEAVRGAEQLPLANLDRFAQMKDGQTIFSAAPHGVTLLHLATSRSQPVDEAQARPAIEQFLLNERRRKLIEDDMKALRASSKIEYVGSFAADKKAATVPTAAASEAPPLTSIVPALPPGASAAPQIELPAAPINTASMPSGSTLDRGLQGMK